MDRQRVLSIMGKDALERAENPLNWPQNREMSHHGDEVWRLKPEISRDTKSQGGNLCDMCRTIDFEYLLENKLADNKDEVPLGYLDSIMAKDQCAFCRLVVWSIRQFTPLDPLPTEINGERIKVDIRNILLGGAQRYVTLSYMWGVNPFYTARKENWTRLQEAGAIDVNDECFPLTIRDAMQVTKELGTDAHYGLPGVSRPRDQPQQVERVQGLQLANALPLTFKVIDASTWNTRAWTFQERLLSKRLLIFTDQQCHFNCMYGNYCEELILEDYDDQGVIFKEVDSWVSFDNEPESHRLTRGTNFGAYITAVENFTTRNITYDEDTLNAFAGIMSSLERIFRGPFVYGLPATMFTSTLLWMPNRSLTRRRDKNGRPLFPSWCWASWIGRIHYHIIGLFGRFASPRVLWKDFKTGTWFSDEKSNPTSLWKTNPDWVTGGIGIGYFIDEREKSSFSFAIPVEHDGQASRVQRTELDSGVLHFWSHIAAFALIPKRSQKGLKDSCCKQVHHYTIHSSNGNDIGILFFDTSPPQPLDMMLQTTLALLSRQVNINNDRELHGDLIYADLTTPFDLQQFKADRAELDEVLVQEATEQSTDAALTSMYHVMAIEQIGDIYERVGIGVIHMEAFHESKPVRTLIRLG